MRSENRIHLGRFGRTATLLSGSVVVAAGMLSLTAAGASAAATVGGPRPAAANNTIARDRVTAGDLVSSRTALVALRPRPLTEELMAASGFACVVEVKRSKTVFAYQNATAFGQGHSYTFNYTLNPYGVKHARIFNGRLWTYQLSLCETGSGHVWNSWHQYFDGASEMVLSRSPHMIGRTWATGVASGRAFATINFSLNAGKVTIGGSTTISSYGTHTGDTGNEPNISLPGSWRYYNINRVNAFYQSPANFKWDGTGAEEGNVGHGLYEWVTGGTANWVAGIGAQLWAFCAKIIGNCAPLN